jgi:hypothetical protein
MAASFSVGWNRCHPWREIAGFGLPGPAIHGRAFADAEDADRASSRRVRSPHAA